MNFITQFFLDLINGILQGVTGPIQPIIQLMGNTPLQYTTANPIVIGVWNTLTAAADTFLVLLVTVKAIQMMYGQSTGTLYMPVSQFLPRLILTAILIHMSFLLGQDLLIFNNQLCGLVQTNVQDFIQQVNGGQPFNVGQNLGLAAVLAVVFTFSLIRVLLQAIKRIVFFNVLFVLSGPAFLMSFDAQTAPWFSFWARTYVVTIFTQFFQFLTLGLGFQFLVATKQTGLTGFFLAIAMLNLTAEIPALLSRFSATAGANTAGIGALVRSAITASLLFA